jgi:outer membrane protein assembly factor BamB
VYVSETDSVMAINAATGATIWSIHPDSQTIAETALDTESFYTGQRGVPTVYALNRASGTSRWKVNVGASYALPAHVRGVAVVADTVYVAVERFHSVGGGTSSGVLVALNRADGREVWRYETPPGKHYFLDAPIPAGGVVIVNDVGAGDAVAISVATRAEVWRTPVGAATHILVRDQTVYTGGNRHAMALELATGAIRWSSETGSTAYGLGYCGESLLVSANALRRFAGATGNATGELPADAGYVSRITTDGTRAYLTGTVGTLAVLCADT